VYFANPTKQCLENSVETEKEKKKLYGYQKAISITFELYGQCSKTASLIPVKTNVMEEKQFVFSEICVVICQNEKKEVSFNAQN
jgi:hypothetical protein